MQICRFEILRINFHQRIFEIERHAGSVVVVHVLGELAWKNIAGCMFARVADFDKFICMPYVACRFLRSCADAACIPFVLDMSGQIE